MEQYLEVLAKRDIAISLKLNKKLLAEIDEDAKKMGLSRADYCILAFLMLRDINKDGGKK